MASTAGGLARLQLRQFVPKGGIVSTPSCSYSTAAVSRAAAAVEQCKLRSSTISEIGRRRRFGSSASQSSSWPAGAVGHAESDELPVTPNGKGKGKALTRIPSPPRSKTIADIQALKHHPDGSIPIVCLTAYDFPSALSIRSADVDLCLIGDSLANVALGYTSTQPLSLEAMIHHCQAVKRGLDAPLFATASVLEGLELPPPPLVIADMPFGATFGSIDSGVAAVVRLIQETGADGVKIEGSCEVVPLIQRLTDHGIPVMGHLGLQPQRVGATSGYRVQGKTAQQVKEMLDASLALERAGCFSIVLECIPSRVGQYISQRLRIPTIGIGAGSKTDGQILVMNDMIGDLTGAGHVLAALAQSSQTAPPDQSVAPPTPSPLTPPPPKFVRNFSLASGTSIGALRIAAVQAYTEATRKRQFPDDDAEGYKIKADEWRAFLQLVEG
ncbi:related to ECM31-3-methyl-2-oxobutanoate hydroxymethyltransferase [Sporisorium reilianum f. sp. reilianum]|uniref:3-methyl-2-oxobutanoate hydroxymethyltransferase n=1 Tax=Sporisorium reilianum f. sp. reilianum TaxID=72559 RepID=A0A2N8UIY2_9BASI|nr:related to ECM31-3-methyl-2-oxobutanoate hydroxymethyltransferase [Sporisorium reilianum f. sp. reilianum]